MKHYIIYSRTNLKKNSFFIIRRCNESRGQAWLAHDRVKRRTKRLIPLLFLFPLFYLSAIDVSYELSGNNLLIGSVSAPPMKTQSILDSMEIGHRTEIEFVIRVYQNKPGFFSFLGDRLETEGSESYVATRDPVSGIFKIEKSNGQKIKIENEESFFNTFFSAENIKIDLRGAEKGEYYILSRIELKVIKLIPPFNLLSDIIPGIITKTDWVKVGTFRIN